MTEVAASRSLRALLSHAPMNKAELVDEVQKQLGAAASKAAAERATDAVLAAVKRGLRRDKEVSLVGFGTFAVVARPARRGFNPHTKLPMTIPAMKTVRFKAGEQKLLGVFIGAALKKLRGAADAGAVRQAVLDRLK